MGKKNNKETISLTCSTHVAHVTLRYDSAYDTVKPLWSNHAKWRFHTEVTLVVLFCSFVQRLLGAALLPLLSSPLTSLQPRYLAFAKCIQLTYSVSEGRVFTRRMLPTKPNQFHYKNTTNFSWFSIEIHQSNNKVNRLTHETV